MYSVQQMLCSLYNIVDVLKYCLILINKHWACSRMMYWSVIGDHSHIEESAMDGSMRRVLLDKNLRRPTGMCSYFQCDGQILHFNCISFNISL